MMKSKSLKNNLNVDKRARGVIAQGALTNSKMPRCFVRGIYPTHIRRGKFCYLWDADGNRYIDYICALGTNLLGYANQFILDAVSHAAIDGNLFSLSSIKEVEFAEQVREFFPIAEKIKILKSGTEGCNASVRIARAFTGRTLVLSEGYHGWGDDFTSLTPPAHGVPQRDCISLLQTPFNETLISKAAAVIIEPVITDISKDRMDWLNELRHLCDKYQTLLIFDETITALRFPGYSFSRWSGIVPDLIVFGKALGAGYPISVVGGRAAAMDCDYFVSTTFAGDLSAITAASTVLKLLVTDYDLEALWNYGNQFLTLFNSFYSDVQIKGYATRGAFVGDPMKIALFFQECCKAGILFGPSWFFCFPHVAEMDNVLSVCRAVLRRIESGQVSLEGELPRQATAAKVRGDK